MYAEAMELPLYRANILGTVLNTNLEYEPNEDKDEVEDLFRILKTVKEELELKNGYKIEGVSSGAIMSTCTLFEKVLCFKIIFIKINKLMHF
jgi:diphthamide synthase (EF-2-diphthine--ammonia ligase)